MLMHSKMLRFASYLHCHTEIHWTYKNLLLQFSVGIFRNTGLNIVHANKQLEIIGPNDTQITNDID
jgi:hypothetical protein